MKNIFTGYIPYLALNHNIHIIYSVKNQSSYATGVCVKLTEVRDGVCVDVAGEELLWTKLLLRHNTVRQFKALQLPWFTGQFPINLNCRAV